MGPKVDAAIRFLEGGGRRAIITSLETAMPALLGETGTHIVADEDLERDGSKPLGARRGSALGA